MKNFYSRLLTFLVLFLGASSLVPQVFGQAYNSTPTVWLNGKGAPPSIGGSHGYASAIAIDKSDNVYFADYSGTTTNNTGYEIRKATTSTAAGSVAICSGLGFGSFQFPRSLVVSSTGNVFFIEPLTSNGLSYTYQIDKLTPTGGNNYTKTVVRTGTVFTALALDASDNLYTIETLTTSPEKYKVMKYTAGAESSAGVQQGTFSIDRTTSGGTVNNTYPWGLAVDASNNIYVTGFGDGTATDYVYKYPAGSSTPTVISTKTGDLGLMVDASGNVFTTAMKSGSTMHVVEYFGPNPSSTNSFEAGTGIASDGQFGFAWGIAMDSHKDLYVTDGFNNAYKNSNFGRIVKYSAGVTGTVSRLSTNPTNTTGTVQYQVVFDQGVNNVTTANFALAVTGLGGTPAVTAVTALNSTTYTVTLSTGTGTGTIDLKLVSGGTMDRLIVNQGAVNVPYTIDRTPPSGSFTIGNGTGYTSVVNPTINITPSDAATMAFSLSGGAYSTPETIANSKVYTLAATEGVTQTVAMRFIDAVGNIQTTAAQNIVWDTTKPKITFTSVPPVFTNNNNFGNIIATVGSGGGDASTFQVSFDNGAYVQYTTVFGTTLTYPTGVLADGPHKITIKATDKAGNVSDPTTYSWTIDRTAPTIATVTPPADGYYNVVGPNTSLQVQIQFSEAVNVTNTPTITATIGGVTKTLNYVSGSGTNTLTFQYNIVNGDNGTVVYGLPVLLTGGSTVKDLAGNAYVPPAGTTLPKPGEIVNTVYPTVAVSTTAPATVTAPFTVHVQFSEAVTGFVASDLTLTNATADAPTTTNNIGYDVLIHPITDGNVTVTVPANAAVNVANNPNTAAPAGITVYFDDQPAAVTSVTVPGNGTYGIGKVLTFVVNYSKTVNVTGTPQLPLTVGSTTYNLNYAGGTGTAALTFTYTVANGDQDLNGVQLGSAILLNSGTIIGTNNKNAGLTLIGVPSTANVLVDGIPPVVTSVTPPADGVYNLVTPTMTFVVHYSKVVTVTGTPTIDLTIGSTVRSLNYISGSGSNALTFQYTVVSPDNDMNGVVLGSAINLAGGTIKDAATNDAVLTLNSVGSTANVNVNTTQPSLTISMTDANPVNHAFTITIVSSEKLNSLVPGNFTISSGTVTSVSTTDNITYTALVTPTAQGAGTVSIAANLLTGAISGNKNTASNILAFNFDNIAPVVTSVGVPIAATYIIGQPLTFTVNFSEPVSVNTTTIPYLELTIGSTVQHAAYVSGSGSTALTFTYTVQEGDLDNNGIAISNGSIQGVTTIRDAAANDANLTLNGVGSLTNVLVDGVKPTITSVVNPADGVYNTNTKPAMTFFVVFSEPIKLTGTAKLSINIGGVVKTMSTTSLYSPNTLQFVYNIVNGDQDMDGIEYAGFDLSAATITDIAGNPATIDNSKFTAMPGVKVNTTHPTVTLSTTAPSPTNKPFTVTAVFSEVVTGLTVNKFVFNTVPVLSNFNTTDGITYTFDVQAGVTGPVTVSLPANAAVNIGNNGNTASNTLTVNYDITPPVINSVTVPTVGTYKIGAPLTFAVKFSKVVILDPTTTPYIEFTIGSSTVHANYVSGSGTNTFTFTYTVQEGDLENTGITITKNTIQNVTAITDAATNAADLTLGILGQLVGVKVDGVKPFISTVTNPADGVYNTTTKPTLKFDVVFSEPITVTGTPKLSINIGGAVKVMTGTLTGGNTLHFEYNVVDGDMDMDGIEYAGLDLSAATITDIAGNPATIDNSKFTAMPNVLVNTNHPTVVLTKTVGSLINKPFTVTATFSEAVTGLTAGSFVITNGTVSALTTSDNIVYTFTVTPTANGTVTVALPANAAVNIGNNGNTAATPLTVTYDGTIPVVNSVTVPAPGTYKIGDVLTFVVNWSKVVTLDPTTTPYLELTIGSTVQHATYTGGSGTNAYTFSYTVQTGDLDNNGITISKNTIQNVTSITDAATNVADLTLNSVGVLTGVNVDGVKPFISTVTNPADGVYNTTTKPTLKFDVVFSEPITVTGTPKLSINIGGAVKVMTGTLTGGNTLHFEYNVVDGDMDMDGIEYAGLDLSAATITDIAGNPATIDNSKFTAMPNVLVNTNHPTVVLTKTVGSLINKPFTVTATFSEAVTGLTAGSFVITNGTVSALTTSDNIVYTFTVTPTANGTVTVALPANAAVNIGNNGNTAATPLTVTYDGTIPVVNSVTVPAPGTYKIGDVLTFVVNWSKVVTLDPTTTPYLELTIGSTVQHATYTGGSGTNAYTFSYTVQTGDLDNNGITISKNTIQNVTSITDAATNVADLTLNSVGVLTGVNVDGVKPFISTVTNPADGVYNTTTKPTLKFDVVFSEPITVTGTPKLSINIGGAVKVMTGTLTGGNTLHFEYNVVDGDMDMDGIEYAGLDLSAATITDIAGNPATIDNSKFTAMPNVLVNTNHPTVVLTKTVGSLINKPFTVTATFSEAVTGLTAGSFVITNGTVSALTTSDNIVYTFTVTPTANGTVTVALPANAAVNIGNNGNTAATPLTVTYDGTIPVVNSVTVPAPGTYKIGDVLTFVVNWSKVVTLDPTVPYLELTIGSTVQHATYSGGSGTNAYTFSYTVQTGDLDNNGITISKNTIQNVTAVTDAATNVADLTLNNIGTLTGVNVDGINPVISTVTNPADGVYNTNSLPTLKFDVVFSEPITVTGTPKLSINIGGAVKVMTGTLTGGNTLHFEYNIVNGDMDMNGIEYAGLDLSAATITDIAGNPAIIDNSKFTAMPNVKVNTGHPTVVLTSASPALTNQPIVITATFSEAVTGLTAAKFTVANGTAANLATTDNITYTITVTPVADGAVSVVLPANAAVNIGNNGNSASNTLAFTFDGTAPTVSSVTLPPASYYTEGTVLQFTVHMSEPVIITGTPVLNFKIGSTGVTAQYASGTQDLVFTYTVKAGDNGTLDATSASINLGGGTIKDAAGNNAVLTFPVIPASPNVIVNTVHPTVVVATTAAARVNTPVNVTFTFSEAMTGFTLSGITVTNGTAANLTTTDNITYNAIITPTADGTVTVNVPANVATNVAGNKNQASNTISFTYDATAPVVTAATFNVSGDAPLNTLVGTVAASDASGVIQNWTISNDPTGGAFVIDANGKITVNNIAQLKLVAATTVTLQVTVSDGLNTSLPANITINVGSLFVNQAPTMDPIKDQAICADLTAHIIQLTNLSAVETDQTYAVSISTDQPLFDVLSVTHDGILTFKLKTAGSTGVAHVTVTIKDNGGTINHGVDTLQRMFTITVNPTPVVTITSDKGTSVSKGDNIILTATGGDTYVWDMVDGIISGQQTATLHARVKANTVYTVTATNIYGCSSSASISVAANTDFKVDANNIVTPNGDGVNDKWVIKNLDSYPDNEVKIYDRAGRLVYQRKNYSNDWDGTVDGSPLSEGTYYYILTIQNGAKTTKGFITIIR
ncbi:Ig-like domain-containing protein [Chitinophaga sp. Hz27]|uniref:Ig-like domain-containing protein n=1 Tax=Chitinophaga sp. Hz27 TaxID=3347169 RepID=UPI0035E1643F